MKHIHADPLTRIKKDRERLSELRWMLAYSKKTLAESIVLADNLVSVTIPKLQADIPDLEERICRASRRIEVEVPKIERNLQIEKLRIQIQRLTRLKQEEDRRSSK